MPRQRSVHAFVLLLVLAGASSALGRELPVVKPERVGLSAVRLARLTDHMNQAVADGVMVGGLVSTARDYGAMRRYRR